jgi:hypothetical protein
MSLLVNADDRDDAVTVIRNRLVDPRVIKATFAGDEQVTLWKCLEIETIPDEGVILDAVVGLAEETPGLTFFLPACQEGAAEAYDAGMPDEDGGIKPFVVLDFNALRND